jgi:hypothetical protein
MKVSIVHDDQGAIISITHVNPAAVGGVTVVAGAGQSVVDLELGKEYADQTLLDLHMGYRVDKAGPKLVAKK